MRPASRAHLGTTTKSARKRSAAVCGAPAAAARRGHAFWDHSATLGIRTCCGWSFGHSRGPVVVPRCALPLPGALSLLASGPALGKVVGQPDGLMNIHHLELFYYVARHGGISEAVRNIPYGIQQPAVSAQIIQLEESLGVTLFNRRPFSLTVGGEKLFCFIQPFFDGLESLADELRGGAAQQLRFGASGTILRDHLPELARHVRKKFPNLKLTLREGHQPQLENWLQKQELDLAVTLLEGKPPAGVNSLPLLKLPLVLLVEKSCRLPSAGELWKRDKIEETLISLPPYEAITKHFQ